MAFLTVAEIFVFCLAGFVLFQGKRNPIAESAACAIVSTLMLLSLISQLTLVFQIPFVFYTVEAVLLLFAIRILYRQGTCLHQT